MTYQQPGPAGYSNQAPDAIVAGWRTFSANPWPWVGFTALAAILTGVVSGVASAIIGRGWDDLSTLAGFQPRLDPWVMGSMFISAFIMTFVLALMCHAAVQAVEGHRITLRDLLEVPEPIPVVIVAVVVAALNVVLGFVPIAGSILRLLLWLFVAVVLLVVARRRVTAEQALRTAWWVLRRYPALFIVVWLLAILINIVGAFFCLIGLLASIPVTVLAQAHAMRRIRY